MKYKYTCEERSFILVSVSDRPSTKSEANRELKVIASKKEYERIYLKYYD